MQRKRPPRKAAAASKVPRHRRDAVIPAVPTVQQDLETRPQPPITPEDDPTEDAVRRIVEAAYT